VKGAFDLLDQLGDVIKGEPRAKQTKIAGSYLERLPRAGRASSGQPASQSLVDNIPEGITGALGFRLKFCGDIVVQCERRSHALMLSPGHHDVNP
jgi:hypothetical protein